MKYKLCIESDSGKINVTDPKIIKRVSIAVSQKDKFANDRSDQLFGDMVIEGVLTDKSQKETKEIFEWSMKTDKTSVYKTVSLQVSNQNELLRDYYLKDMYCVSYEEIFDEYQDQGQSNSIGSFKLVMKQRVGSIETIKVSCE